MRKTAKWWIKELPADPLLPLPPFLLLPLAILNEEMFDFVEFWRHFAASQPTRKWTGTRTRPSSINAVFLLEMVLFQLFYHQVLEIKTRMNSKSMKINVRNDGIELNRHVMHQLNEGFHSETVFLCPNRLPVQSCCRNQWVVALIHLNINGTNFSTQNRS